MVLIEIDIDIKNRDKYEGGDIKVFLRWKKEIEKGSQFKIKKKR